MLNVFSRACVLFLIVMLAIPNNVVAQQSPSQLEETPGGVEIIGIADEAVLPQTGEVLIPNDEVEESGSPTATESTAPTDDLQSEVTIEPEFSPEVTATGEASSTENVVQPTEKVEEFPAAELPNDDAAEPTDVVEHTPGTELPTNDDVTPTETTDAADGEIATPTEKASATQEPLSPSESTPTNLMVGTPVVAALDGVTVTANPEITLSAESGYRGDVLVVRGNNLQANDYVEILWNLKRVGYLLANSDGSFVGKITVPRDASYGTATLQVSFSGNAWILAYDVLPNPNSPDAIVILSPNRAAPGQRVLVTGSNFAPNERVNIRWGGPSGTILGYKNATAEGNFSGYMTIPVAAESGSTAVYLQSTSATASAALYVESLEPNFWPWPQEGRAGEAIPVYGYDFAPNESVSIYWGSLEGRLIGVTTANDEGDFVAKITVPYSANPGQNSIYAIGATRKLPTNGAFNVLPSPAATASVSPSSAKPGAKISVSGTNFQPGERVNIRWGSATGPILGYKNATTTGTFSGAVLVPAGATAGTTRIYLQSSSASSFTSFTVLETPTPRVSMSPTTAFSGDRLGFTGSNFRPGERVSIRWGSTTGTIVGYVTVNSTGTISGAVLVPSNATAGTTTVYFASASGTGSVGFTVVTPKITLTSGSAPSNTIIYASGSGFLPWEVIHLTGGPANEQFESVWADSNGVVDYNSILIPIEWARGTYTISFTGEISKRTVRTTFTVTSQYIYRENNTARISLTSSSGPSNNIIYVSGSGFRPNEFVQLIWSGTNEVLGVAWADVNGTLENDSLLIPAYPPLGTYRIIAVGEISKNTGSASYRVTSTYLHQDSSRRAGSNREVIYIQTIA